MRRIDTQSRVLRGNLPDLSGCFYWLFSLVFPLVLYGFTCNTLPFSWLVFQAAPLFIYDCTTGTLRFDANASGADGLSTLATLTDQPPLVANGILIVAS